MADATIHGIEFEIKGSSDAAVKSIERLSAALRKIQKATSGGLGLSKVAGELQTLNNAIQNMNLAQVAAFAAALKAIGRIKINNRFATSISEISKAVKGLKPDNLTKVSEALVSLANLSGGKVDADGLATVTEYLKQISMIDFTNLTNAANALREISETTGIVNPGANGSEATAAAEEQVSAWNRVKDAMLGVIKLGGRLIALPFKRMGKDISGVASKVGNLFSSLKRIAFYRLIRSAIRAITTAFKEGINNAYQWSKVMGGPVSASGMTLAASLDDMATSLKYLKNGIGSMVAPLIGTLAPAIRVATDAIVEFLNVVNQLMALLTGQSGWMRATRQAEEYEEAVGGAGGAAKEALRYLAPFDELNVLPSQKQGGGGGGGEDYGGMFEEMVEFEQGVLDFANRIKQAVEDSDWQGLGTLIGDKINELVDNIDFAASGAKIGEKINALFTTKYWALDTINFQNIGASIAEYLIAMVENIDFEIIGRSIIQKFTIIGDLIVGFFEGLADNDGEGVTAVATAVSNFINGAINEALTWLKENYSSIMNVATTIADLLNRSLENIEFKDLGETLTTIITDAIDFAIAFVEELDFGEMATALSDFILGVLNKLSEWIEKVDWGEVTTSLINGIVDFISNLQLGEILSAIGKVVGAIGGALIEMALEIVKDVFVVVSDPDWWDVVWKWFQETVVEGFANLGNNIANALIDNIEDGLNEFADVWNDSAVNQWIQDTLGWDWDIPPIQFGFEIEPINIDAGYEEAKAKYEAKSKEDPVGLKAAIEEIISNLPQDQPKVPVTGMLDTLIDQLDESAKEVFVTATVDDFEAKIKPKMPVAAEVSEIVESENIYELRGIVGVVESAEPSPQLVDNPPGIYTRALYKWTDNSLLTRAQRTFNVWANYAWVKKDELTKEQRTIGTYSNFKWVKTDALTKDQKTINTYSNFKWVKTGELTESQKTIGGMVAKFKYVIKSTLTEAQKTIDTKARYVGTIFSALTAADRSIDATALFKGSKLDDSIKDAYGRIKVSATANIEGVTGQTTITMIPQALGGIFSSGFWRSIPQYAGGGRAHGSMFVAGEAGPEIVGHIGGRTEVLNRSQLAATMYAAVRSAMSGIVIRPVTPESYMDENTNEETVYRAFVRAINDTGLNDEKELDGDVLYRAMVNRNRRNTRMTGVNAMA